MYHPNWSDETVQEHVYLVYRTFRRAGYADILHGQEIAFLHFTLIVTFSDFDPDYCYLSLRAPLMQNGTLAQTRLKYTNINLIKILNLLRDGIREEYEVSLIDANVAAHTSYSSFAINPFLRSFTQLEKN